MADAPPGVGGHQVNEYGWCDRCGDRPTSANGDNAYPFVFVRPCRKATDSDEPSSA